MNELEQLFLVETEATDIWLVVPFSVYQFMRQQRTTHLVVTVLDEHKKL